MDQRSGRLRTVLGDPGLAYVDTGRRDPPPVILLHSLGTDYRLWSPQIAPLGADLRVVAVDSRGHGESG